jgi:hypothetical protein
MHAFFALSFSPLQITFHHCRLLFTLLLLQQLLLFLLARLRFPLHREKVACIKREELKRQLGRKSNASASRATNKSSQRD